MTRRQRRSIQRLYNVRLFLRMHGYFRGAPALYSKSMVRLSDSLDRIERLELDQVTSRPSIHLDGRTVAELRRVLRREFMMPLVRAGRRELMGAPDVERVLVVPHASKSHAEVVAAAKEMLKFAKPHRKLLTEAGFEPDFLARFRAATTELQRVTTSSYAARTKHGQATKELRLVLKEANETVRIIEGFLTVRLDRDPVLARAWKHASRLPKLFGRPPKRSHATRAPRQQSDEQLPSASDARGSHS